MTARRSKAGSHQDPQTQLNLNIPLGDTESTPGQAAKILAPKPSPTKPPAPKAVLGEDPVTVTELTRYLEALIGRDPLLSRPIPVRGELSNVKHSSRGHVYLTLKDATASLSGVIWASTARLLPFTLEDGLEVDVVGTLEIYPPNGTYSIKIQRIMPVGTGSLQLAFQQLKEKLTAEGLFLEEYKKPLPSFPLKIGIVTSRTGAVIHDMLRVIRRKNPLVDVLLHPVKVQGEGAALEISTAVKELNHPSYGLDLLIVARGGGSLEDLFCFSEEPVVRAIFASQVPVVTGIGHEPDFSLADAAADYSASTPTAAAEHAVPDIARMQGDLNLLREHLTTEMQRYLLFYEQQLDLRATECIDQLNRAVQQTEHHCGMTQERLMTAMERHLVHCQHRVSQTAESMDAYNPLKTLARGYTQATQPDGSVIRSVATVAAGDRFRLILSDGLVDCEVLETHARKPVPHLEQP